MLKFGFGKRPKHRNFDYKPRFYDERKEFLEGTIEKYDDNTRSEEKVKAGIRSGLRKKYGGNEALRASNSKRANLRIFYILVVLCFISYLILTSDGILTFIEGIDG